MSARVYILVNATETKRSQIAQVLQEQAGVRMIDMLEGLPNMIIMVEASNREHLAELAVQAIASVESLTDGLKFLPAQNGNGTYYHKSLTRRGLARHVARQIN